MANLQTFLSPRLFGSPASKEEEPDPIAQFLSKMEADEAKALAVQMSMDRLSRHANEERIKKMESDQKLNQKKKLVEAETVPISGNPEDGDVDNDAQPNGHSDPTLDYIMKIEDEGERQRRLDQYQEVVMMKRMPPEMAQMGFFFKHLGANRMVADANATAAQPVKLSDMTGELRKVREDMIEMGMVADPKAVSTAPVSTGPPKKGVFDFEDEVTDAIRGRVKDKVLEAFLPPAAAPAVPAKPEGIKAKFTSGKIGLAADGMEIDLTPAEYIQVLKVQGDNEVNKLKAEAEGKNADTIKTGLNSFLMPVVEAGLDTLKEETAQRNRTEKPFFENPCPDCYAAGEETMLHIDEPQPNVRYKCPKAATIHPQKPLLEPWNPNPEIIPTPAGK